jgi:alpha-tubulin suppressor-like RCC1 family protein
MDGTMIKAGTSNQVPALIDPSALGVVRQLALGGAHSCALREDGRVLCWGYNIYGQLGHDSDTSTETPNPVPTRVEGLPPLLP